MKEKYGKLTPIRRLANNKHGQPVWLFKCDCGREKAIMFYTVKYRTKSCGCLIGNKTPTKHGESRRKGSSKEYVTWGAIKTRTTNPKYHAYHRYGGRGIRVCERWLNSFENFLEDMGRAPGPEYSIDRINNDGNYEPNNCRWATRAEQGLNQGKRSKK